VPHVAQVLDGTKGVYVAASDYVQALPASIARWVPGRFYHLGTDGYGRSSDRKGLRELFEVDARYIALTALRALVADGHLERGVLRGAIADLGIDPGKINPLKD